MKPASFILTLIGFLMLAGCAGSVPGTMPSGQQAYAIFPSSNLENRASEYKIGPLDELEITVFQEPDLSLKKVPVDASGNILFPLIGLVEASGQTSQQLANQIAQRLSNRFLVNPQVLVNVATSASLSVTVEGQVSRPGVYPITGQTTLLQAIANAQGPTQTAKLDEVIVFRRTEGKQFAARFDLSAIRTGVADDPEIRGNDVVVVGISRAKSLYRDLLTALPGLGSIFIAINR